MKPLQGTLEKSTTTVFRLKGEEYMPVSNQETLSTVSEAGFNNEVYAPRHYSFEFVKSMMSDDKTVQKLRNNITDERPLIFHLEKGPKRLKEEQQRYGGKILNGNDWSFLVTNFEDAWMVFVSNYDP